MKVDRSRAGVQDTDLRMTRDGLGKKRFILFTNPAGDEKHQEKLAENPLFGHRAGSSRNVSSAKLLAWKRLQL